MPAPGRTGRRAGRLAGPLAVAAGAVLATSYLAVVDPEQPGHYPTCPFLALTGWACPGCGTLRAVHALAHGELGTALHRNPLTVLAVAALAVLWVRWAGSRLRGGPGWAPTVPNRVLWALGSALIAFTVLRNLPGVGWLGP